MNYKYNIISKNDESTVVAEYIPTSSQQSNKYQSEAQLEKEFIEILKAQSYEYIDIKEENDLFSNLKNQLEKLNDYKFSNNEWDNFFYNIINNPNISIQDKTEIIQNDFVQNLKLDDGSSKNIYLLNKENIHKNSLQVINQYTNESVERKNRYDVTILINGLPIVHIELKRRGVSIKEAFNQIKRYSRESFTGLFDYIQVFVISNGTETKYYSNTTRYNNNKDNKKNSNNITAFEFTSYWMDTKNKQILDLVDFTKTFFAKHTILNLITKYCVFTVDKKLLVMRPYQITATEKILSKIEIGYNNKYYGSKKAGGYVWHTTGSGKTLTSFKVAILVSELQFINKVLFVVDRKDLDYQTMQEYDKFQKGSANSNSNTQKLKQQLENLETKIIITTIQKLSNLVKTKENNPVFSKHIVFIFDECHRSQFGKMHTNIIKNFKNYYIFGFTGTPIFTNNAQNYFKTTEQIFGDKLHTYTIIDAINDKNVLPFKIEYTNTIKSKEGIENIKVRDINREKALSSPDRITKIVEYVIKHFDQKTKRNDFYKLDNKRLKGFNSIFAVSSIDTAKKYYTEFKKQLNDNPSDKQFKIAIIYSFLVNEDIDCIIDDENLEDTNKLDKDSRDFLEEAIKDYNKIFETNYDTSSDKFQNYYKDISKRIKAKEIDLTIVVNMFLTGFDATCVNTLWVDKNLRMHGLLQAFSRTNRILNSVKSFGNIVCFRNLEEATKESLALFGNKDARNIVLIKNFDEYNNQYIDLVKKLKNNYPLDNKVIVGEQKQKKFINLYGEILKLINILNSFDEFNLEEVLTAREKQDYQSIYLNLHDNFRNKNNYEKENINDDIIFEIELIKQIEVNIDYILNLIKKYFDNNKQNNKKEISLDDINKAIDSSIELRNKKELISKFIDSLSVNVNVDEKWDDWVKENIKKDLDNIIEQEKLNKEKAYKFMESSFNNRFVKDIGTDINEIMPKISRFNNKEEKNRSQIKRNILEKLKEFLDKYLNIFKKDYLQ